MGKLYVCSKILESVTIISTKLFRRESTKLSKQYIRVIKITTIFTAFLLFIQMPSALATSLTDLKEEKQQVEEKADELNSSINQKSTEINGIENKQDTLMTQIQTLDNQINKTNEDINVVVGDINSATKEIEELQASIEALKKKIEERDVLLRERARAIQAGGSVNYIDVLLGSNSFVDFIDRFSAVNTLMEADRQILRDQKNDKESLEEQKYTLETKLNKLEEDKNELDRLKTSLDTQKSQKDKFIDELESEQEKLRSEKELLEEEYSEALQIEDALQQQIVSEQNRIAEIARQEEARRKAASSTSSTSNGGSLPEVTSGTWMKPTNGRLSSGYGWRNLGNGPEFHYGIDLANSSGTPIVASADGVVSYAAPLSTYGNVIIITHSINGAIYTTVYAHLSGFNVSTGSVVSKGQKIGAMGNTGRSFGSHLHFEVHNGTWKNQKAGNVNPLRYISL